MTTLYMHSAISAYRAVPQAFLLELKHQKVISSWLQLWGRREAEIVAANYFQIPNEND